VNLAVTPVYLFAFFVMEAVFVLSAVAANSATQ
jgi:hypothetical protein